MDASTTGVGGRGSCYWHLETRDTATYPTVDRTATQQIFWPQMSEIEKHSHTIW